jgi:hypothetical protein
MIEPLKITGVTTYSEAQTMDRLALPNFGSDKLRGIGQSPFACPRFGANVFEIDTSKILEVALQDAAHRFQQIHAPHFDMMMAVHH